MVKASWSERTRESVIDVPNAEEAESLLRTLSGSVTYPTALTFSEARSDRSVTVVIGLERVIVTYNESLDPPYYISLGDLSAQGLVRYEYGNQISELPATHLVDFELGVQAVRSFFERPGRFEGVNWGTD